MSAQSSVRNPKIGAFTATNPTQTRTREGLSSEILKDLLEKVQLGDRTQARVFISQTLKVNDVVAECCLRHLEEKLAGEQDYRDRILRQVTVLGAADSSDQEMFLRDAFGVHGIVSKAILNHWRTAGN